MKVGLITLSILITIPTLFKYKKCLNQIHTQTWSQFLVFLTSRIPEYLKINAIKYVNGEGEISGEGRRLELGGKHIIQYINDVL